MTGHDYSSGGKYFITICTRGMIPSFGTISGTKMVLSPAGQIANETWLDLPKHFPNVTLDEFIVMPNHIHGIIIIARPDPVVRTLHATSLPPPPPTALPPPPTTALPPPPSNILCAKNKFMSTISPKRGSLPAVIRSYKSAVSYTVHLTDPDFTWQPRYWDHLIRSGQEMSRIKQYIINNPGKWGFNAQG
jgi:REP element-mobilizing transposase RayT